MKSMTQKKSTRTKTANRTPAPKTDATSVSCRVGRALAKPTFFIAVAL